MGKSSTIDSFFKRKNIKTFSSKEDESLPTSATQSSNPEKSLSKFPRIEPKGSDVSSLEHDPGLRSQIWEHPIDKRDEIRRAYIKAGPYQCILTDYPKSGPVSHPRRFQSSWFNLFPSWLEYSPKKDAAFCLPCFLFNKPGGPSAFTVDGFRNWKKVRDGKSCAFLNHVDNDPNSIHKIAEKSCEDLMNQSQHLQQIVEKHSSQQIANNRLRLKVSIDAVRWLAFQGCAFRGRDESKESLNRGNIIEMLKLLASYNETVADLVLDKAPQNASYTSSQIQKEILYILSSKVRQAIREEIGNAKFCLMVDEARDESKKEQMAIVFRFVDKEGILRERFFSLVHVSDTTALTLKNEIFSILSRHNLDILNIRGQGYDSAMGSSCKRNDELKAAHAAEVAQLIAIDELDTGTGLNQIGTLQHAGDTRWSSHWRSISSLIKMFNATCQVLNNIIEEGTTPSQRGDADSAYQTMASFEFIFILHLMREIMEITDILCQALQRQSQDILNAMHLVSSTKMLIQKLRDIGWDGLLIKVKSFCECHNIDVPDMNARYVARRGRARHQQDQFTIEHHYRVNIFNAAIDCQWQELNHRFSEQAMELLSLSSCLDPRRYKSFIIDDICNLVNKFYPRDFTEQEKIYLGMQLKHYELDVFQHPDFQKLVTISDLCQWLVKSEKSDTYSLIYRLVRLVLTLPVSTATTERSFSAMKFIKTKLRNKMEDDFLTDSLIVYIEREIAEKFSTESIVDDFRDMKEHRVPL